MAFGLDALFLPFVKPLLRRLTVILLGFGTLTFLILFAIDLAKSMNFGTDDRVMISTLAAFLLAGLIYRAGRNDAIRPGLLVLIIGLYIVEIGNVSFYTSPAQRRKEQDGHPPSLRRYRAGRGVLKTSAGNPARVAARRGRSDQFRRLVRHRHAVRIHRQPAFESRQSGDAYHARRMLYGAAYGIAKKPFLDFKQEVFRAPSGLIVYKTPNVFPKVWTVHEGEIVKDREDIRRHLQDDSFDLSKKTFGWTAPPKMDRCDRRHRPAASLAPSIPPARRWT